MNEPISRDFPKSKAFERMLNAMLINPSENETRTDEYQNEFLPQCSERVSWLTGLSGSFAVVIISINKSIIFTDGRYIDQINKEVDKKLFKIININFKILS